MEDLPEAHGEPRRAGYFRAYMEDDIPLDLRIPPGMWAAVYPMQVASDVAVAMLAATLQLLPREAEEALDQIADVLPRMRHRKRLKGTLLRCVLAVPLVLFLASVTGYVWLEDLSLEELQVDPDSPLADLAGDERFRRPSWLQDLVPRIG